MGIFRKGRGLGSVSGFWIGSWMSGVSWSGSWSGFGSRFWPGSSFMGSRTIFFVFTGFLFGFLFLFFPGVFWGGSCGVFYISNILGKGIIGGFWIGRGSVFFMWFFLFLYNNHMFIGFWGGILIKIWIKLIYLIEYYSIYYANMDILEI